MTSRRMAFSADGVLMEIAMPNIQGNSAIHLVEKGGGKYSSFDKHQQFLPTDYPFRRDIKNIMKGVVVTEPALQMLMGAMLHA